MDIAIVETEGSRQIVRFPEGYLVEGSEVILNRVGRTVLLLPKDANQWEFFEKSLELVTEDLLSERVQPSE